MVAPSNVGGINWDGIAVDPRKGRIYARSSNVPFLVRLIRREDFNGREGFDHGGRGRPADRCGLCDGASDDALLLGSALQRTALGVCHRHRYHGGEQLWRVPHGTVRDISPVPIPLALGVPGMGAPILTSSGLLFLAGAWENVIRAYDSKTGEELWKGELPAGPQATPMSYSVRLADGSAAAVRGDRRRRTCPHGFRHGRSSGGIRTARSLIPERPLGLLTECAPVMTTARQATVLRSSSTSPSHRRNAPRGMPLLHPGRKRLPGAWPVLR